MSEWWCIVKGSGYRQWPDKFEKTITRGDKVTGGAWRQDSHFFYVGVAATLPASNEKAALQKFQQKFNKKTGHIGLALPDCPKFEYVKIFQGANNFWQYFNQCGFDVLRPEPPSRAQTSQAIVSVSSQGTEGVDYHSVLGVGPEASITDIKSAGRTLMKLYHPDKGMGDTSMFMAVYDALQALTSNAEICSGSRAIVMEPKKEGIVEEFSPDRTQQEANKWRQYRENLKKELIRAQQMIDHFDKLANLKALQEQRLLAEEYVQKFKMSAQFWDLAQVKCWFQPERYAEVDTDTRKLDALYGPYLRSGCEDLDPYVQYKKLFVQGRKYSKMVQIKVGMDIEDAALHGITLLMPLKELNSTRHKRGLQQAGFDIEIADTMFELNAWHTLHNNGQIEHPCKGVSIDVSTEWQTYQCVIAKRFDPCSHNRDLQRHHDFKQARLMDLSEEERQRRASLPKTTSQLADWIEKIQQEHEPDPEIEHEIEHEEWDEGSAFEEA